MFGGILAHGSICAINSNKNQGGLSASHDSHSFFSSSHAASPQVGKANDGEKIIPSFQKKMTLGVSISHADGKSSPRYLCPCFIFTPCCKLQAAEVQNAITRVFETLESAAYALVRELKWKINRHPKKNDGHLMIHRPVSMYQLLTSRWQHLIWRLMRIPQPPSGKWLCQRSAGPLPLVFVESLLGVPLPSFCASARCCRWMVCETKSSDKFTAASRNSRCVDFVLLLASVFCYGDAIPSYLPFVSLIC